MCFRKHKNFSTARQARLGLKTLQVISVAQYLYNAWVQYWHSVNLKSWNSNYWYRWNRWGERRHTEWWWRGRGVRCRPERQWWWPHTSIWFRWRKNTLLLLLKPLLNSQRTPAQYKGKFWIHQSREKESERVTTMNCDVHTSHCSCLLVQKAGW